MMRVRQSHVPGERARFATVQSFWRGANFSRHVQSDEEQCNEGADGGLAMGREEGGGGEVAGVAARRTGREQRRRAGRAADWAKAG